MVEMMRAALFHKPNLPLTIEEVPVPTPNQNQVLVKIYTCGVCRTDIHIFRSEIKEPELPLIMGHQIIGEIISIGEKVKNLQLHQMVGIPWLGYTCGECSFCREKQENLCDRARFTGYHIPGGFADYTAADARYVFPLPKGMNYETCAPLFCPGFIGLRALKFTQHANTIGFYGFGNSARILIRIALHQKREVYVFTKPGDTKSQEEAKVMGAVWAGGSDESPPQHLDAAILFASVGELVPKALKDVKKGGRVVCAGIHMSDIPSFPYAILWEERSVCSVANLTREDGIELLSYAHKFKIVPEIARYPLEKINDALLDLEKGENEGSPVIVLR